VPPGDGSLRDVVLPAHRLVVPVIGAGEGKIVTVVVVVQPEGSVYVMDAVPADTAETIPVEEPTVATSGDAPVLHVPPPASVRLVVVPTQMDVTPMIGPGNEFTVIFCVMELLHLILSVTVSVTG
jgi:hypothetical protein